jgi:hypothetical protein
MDASDVLPEWKQRERELNARARTGRVHKDRKPGDVLRFSNGLYEVQTSGALKQVHPQLTQNRNA